MKARLLYLWLMAIVVISFCWPGSLALASEATEKMTQNRNKIEELFIWKISDELKLSIKEEKKFSDLFRDLNQKKMSLGQQQDEMISLMAIKTNDKERLKFLNQYRLQLVEYSKIQIREFDELKKILGPERFAKYLNVKRELTNKVKILLTEKSEKKNSDLPPPKVIEE